MYTRRARRPDGMIYREMRKHTRRGGFGIRGGRWMGLVLMLLPRLIRMLASRRR